MSIIKKIVAAGVAACAAVSFAGCSAGSGSGAEEIAAKVNDTEITKEALDVEISNGLANYGMDYDTLVSYYGEETAQDYTLSVLDAMIEQELMLEHADELGCGELSDDEKQEVQDNYDSYITSIKDYVKSQLQEESTTATDDTATTDETTEAADTTTDETTDTTADSAEDVTTDETADSASDETVTDASDESSSEISEDSEEFKTAYKEYLDGYGLTEDFIYEKFYNNAILTKVYNAVLDTMEISEDDYRAYYDKLLEEQEQTDDSDPDTALYNYANSQNEVNVLVPTKAQTDAKYIKHVLIKLDDEDMNTISSLESEVSTLDTSIQTTQAKIDDLQSGTATDLDEDESTTPEQEIETLQAEKADLEKQKEDKQAELDKASSDAYGKIEAKANEVLEKAKAGEDFDSLISEYNDDTGMDSNPDGYLVYEDAGFVPEFIEGANALPNVGDVSQELVKSTYGYHILQYASQPQAGAIPYEDVAESIEYYATQSLEADFWTQTVEGWKEEANITNYIKEQYDAQEEENASDDTSSDESAQSESTDAAADESTADTAE